MAYDINLFIFIRAVFLELEGLRQLKREIEVYTKECNELNDHIEDMKSVDLGFRRSYNGEGKDSNPKINQKYLKYNQRYVTVQILFLRTPKINHLNMYINILM